MRRTSCALWIAVLIGCGGGGKDEPKNQAPEKKDEGTAQPVAGSGSAAKPDDKKVADQKKKAQEEEDKKKAEEDKKKKAEPAPVTAKIKDARCSEPCLMLTDTPLDKLPDTYKTECKKETKALGFEDCKQFDYTRNCIYAAHGLVFKKKKWKVFEKKAWYEATPEFRSSNISKLEQKNVHELLTRARACEKGLLISGGDYERLNTWFRALPKKPADMPAVVWIDEQKSTGDALVKFLADNLFDESDAKKKKRFKFDKKTVASYDKTLDDVIPADAMAAIKAPKGAKLRSIYVDTTTNVGGEDGEITEGVQIRFVYTDKDKLMAVVAQHYLND